MQLAEIPGAVTLTPERLKALCPHYHRVPKDIKKNLAYRKAILKACEDPKVAAAVWQACSQDVLYFINTFVWTLDTHQDFGMNTPEVPMITWRSQDQVILELVDSFGKYDLWCEKSRKQGFTWNVIVVYMWKFLFKRQQHMLLASRNADLVDDPNETSSLMPKLDFILKFLPEFMKPRMERTKMKLVNKDNGSLIKGATTTEDIDRGGRKTSIFIDEFASFGGLSGPVIASTAAVSKNRIFGSTHKGTGTEFYRNTKDRGRKKVLRVHWTTHPVQTRGMYTARNGNLELLDPDFEGYVPLQAEQFKFPTQYPFILDGKVRSPFYDNECLRLNNDPVRIAQELDVSPEESGENFYSSTLLDKMVTLAKQRVICHRGDIMPDWESGEFVAWSDDPDGPLTLWTGMVSDQRMPEHEYVLGVDVATGAGGYMSTNSVIAIGDKWTREKVGEYVTKTRDPHQLATIVYAISHWLAYNDVKAKVIWEAPGPGLFFKHRLVDQLRHPNYYKRQNADKAGTPSTEIPGWYPSVPSKLTVHGNLRTSMESGHYVDPCPECIEEMRHYVNDDNGGVTHSVARSAENANESEANHGDRVIATALMWHLIRGTKPKEPAQREIPEDSFAGRRKLREERKYQETRL